MKNKIFFGDMFFFTKEKKGVKKIVKKQVGILKTL